MRENRGRNGGNTRETKGNVREAEKIKIKEEELEKERKNMPELVKLRGIKALREY